MDVCRPRRALKVPRKVSPEKVVVEPDAAVPKACSTDRTERISVSTPVGVTHAQLRRLAEGLGSPVTLAKRYRLDRRLGRGGMATVFGGTLLTLERPVAVKILDGERGLRDDGLARFLAEARTLAQIRHPNVVEVLDFGSTAQGVVFMVMELLEGEDLQSIMAREGTLDWFSIQGLMRQLCAGLAAVHAAGIVHRDVKPGNCMCITGSAGDFGGDAPGLKLLDFGIATRGGAAEAALAYRDGRCLTEDGRVVGTPEYMSPEQARGDEVDGRSDVYAAGVIFGEMLTGKVPFEGKSAAAIIGAQIYQKPPTLAELGGQPFDPALEAIYAKALAKDPAERYPNVLALGEAIATVELGAPRPRPRWAHKSRRLLTAAALALSSLVSLS